MRRAAVALLLVALFAGCQAPGTTDARPADVNLSVAFDPPYDPQAVLERVERLRGLHATGQIVVHEYPRTPRPPVDPIDRALGIRPTGALVLGVRSSGTVEVRQPLGYTLRENGTVHVYVMSRAGLERFNASQELILAHELVHALQYQHGLVANGRDELRSAFANWTTDARLTALSIIEGDAMVATRTYQRRYAQNASYPTYPRPTPPRAAWQRALGTAPYHVGMAYFEEVGTSSADRSAALRDPPPNTRHLLHPAVSRVQAGVPKGPASVGRFERFWTDTVGELAIKRTLRVNRVSSARAAAAASGWLHDRMAYYESAGGSVVYWRIQWQDAEAAATFVDVYRSVFQARNATRQGDLLVTPATNTTPRTVLAIEVRSDRVVVIGADSVERVRALEAALQNTTRPQGVLARTCDRNAPRLRPA
jgi:hypothetical protein